LIDIRNEQPKKFLEICLELLKEPEILQLSVVSKASTTADKSKTTTKQGNPRRETLPSVPVALPVISN
jgi:hypothetical protein